MDSGYPRSAVSTEKGHTRATSMPTSSSAQSSLAVARAAPRSVLTSADRTDVEPHGLAVADTEPSPLVSVVIVSHNCRGPLLACLRSLGEERELTPLDVILVDNDSGDDTGYAVASEFPWVRLIVNRRNVGFARAINQGLRFAEGQYLLLLNPDTVVPAGTLGRAVGELERRPRVGMLGCKLVRPDGSFDHACKRGFPTVLSALFYFGGLARRFPDSPRFAQYTAAHLGIDETGTVDAINGAFMLVRRSAVDDVGALDERYWLWAEDLDWCHRFWEKGWKILYWPEVEVVHLKSASVGEHRSLRLNFAFHRSIWLFYAKHHAPHRSPVLSALVALGVWSKFVGSAVANTVRSVRPPDARA
jgi:GT2 family glycosyltransferase